MDESSKQHFKEIPEPIPANPGSEEKNDTEYERNEINNLFMFLEPLTGRGRSPWRAKRPWWTEHVKYVT